MAEVTWTRSALHDLKEIHEYISRDSKFYADRYINLLIKRVDQLINFPMSGRIVPEKEDETIRELIEGNYRIFYKVISKDRINILRIHHAAKNIK
jgi:addiction module RelE/StbE family toxin